MKNRGGLSITVGFFVCLFVCLLTFSSELKCDNTWVTIGILEADDSGEI